MLVSTVTPMTRGAGRPSRRGRLPRGLAAACIIGTPPDGVHVDHPCPGLNGRLDGLRDGVGNVVELQVEKDLRRRRPRAPGRATGLPA